MKLDFRTNDNALFPNVDVYIMGTDRTICTVPIENGDVGEAENIAETIIEAMTAYGALNEAETQG